MFQGAAQTLNEFLSYSSNALGQPNENDGTTCGVIKHDYSMQWGDKLCTKEQRFICERDPCKATLSTCIHSLLDEPNKIVLALIFGYRSVYIL